MIVLPAPAARRRASLKVRRAAGMAGLVIALAGPLAGCQSGDARALTPAGQALIASQPALAAANVPPPPAIAGIVSAPAPSAASGVSGELDAANARLDTALNNASACSADTQCRAIAVGARACGGPTGYRAYSTTSAASADIDALAQRQRELSAEAARASHQVSPCFMLADPGARCYQNKCVTGRSPLN
jgi:hypothetical protein